MTVPKTTLHAAVVRSLVGAVVLAGGQWVIGVQAQQRPAVPSTAQPKLETLQIRPNFYVIFGAGANIGVHVGEDGVILVDTGTAASADAVNKQLRSLAKEGKISMKGTHIEIFRTGKS